MCADCGETVDDLCGCRYTEFEAHTLVMHIRQELKKEKAEAGNMWGEDRKDDWNLKWNTCDDTRAVRRVQREEEIGETQIVYKNCKVCKEEELLLPRRDVPADVESDEEDEDSDNDEMDEGEEHGEMTSIEDMEENMRDVEKAEDDEGGVDFEAPMCVCEVSRTDDIAELDLKRVPTSRQPESTYVAEVKAAAEVRRHLTALRSAKGSTKRHTHRGVRAHFGTGTAECDGL